MALCCFGMLGMWHLLCKEVVNCVETTPESEDNDSVLYCSSGVHMSCVCKPSLE